MTDHNFTASKLHLLIWGGPSTLYEPKFLTFYWSITEDIPLREVQLGEGKQTNELSSKNVKLEKLHKSQGSQSFVVFVTGHENPCEV